VVFEDASVGCEGEHAHVVDEQAVIRQGDRVEVASYTRGGAVEVTGQRPAPDRRCRDRYFRLR
jgi:hypothetical protein